jgi:hypothetical protein
VHSSNHWHVPVGIDSALEKPQAGQVIVDSSWWWAMSLNNLEVLIVPCPAGRAR